MEIVFNRPQFTGREFQYLKEALENGHLSGNGPFTRRCHSMFRGKYGFAHSLLTSSARLSCGAAPGIAETLVSFPTLPVSACFGANNEVDRRAHLQ